MLLVLQLHLYLPAAASSAAQMVWVKSTLCCCACDCQHCCMAQIADEFNAAIVITNQVMSDPSGGAMFVSDPKKAIGKPPSCVGIQASGLRSAQSLELQCSAVLAV